MNQLEWIFSDEAELMLEKIRQWENIGKSTLQILKLLRKEFVPETSSQLMELTELRKRGLQKFQRAGQMFFSRKQLEQATSEIVSQYKAQRFAEKNSVVDLCCGIGGDALALANPQRDLSIVDSDELTLKMASHNLRVHGHEAIAHLGTAEGVDVKKYDAFHIDPDRRPNQNHSQKAGRTVTAENFSPSLDILREFEKSNPNFGIKLAPASEIWTGDYEIEFIGHLRECKQQMVWSGDLIRTRGRTATVIAHQGNAHESFSFDNVHTAHASLATSLKKYVYDPHSALLASGLTEAFATQYSLESLGEPSCYLTSDKKIQSLLASCFEVVASLPAQLKVIEKFLQQQEIGKLEVKKRGALDTVHRQLNKLNLKGHKSLTIILSDTPFGYQAIACKRFQSLETEPPNA